MAQGHRKGKGCLLWGQGQAPGQPSALGTAPPASLSLRVDRRRPPLDKCPPGVLVEGSRQAERVGTWPLLRP